MFRFKKNLNSKPSTSPPAAQEKKISHSSAHSAPHSILHSSYEYQLHKGGECLNCGDLGAVTGHVAIRLEGQVLPQHPGRQSREATLENVVYQIEIMFQTKGREASIGQVITNIFQFFLIGCTP